VSRRKELDPPISSKTLERWETPGARVKRWRLRQLARIYGVAMGDLLEHSGAVAGGLDGGPD